MSAAAPPASIVVPTRGRAGYLDVALRSFMPQAADAGAEVIVVVDGHDPESVLVAQRRGAHVIAHPEPRGPNAARNAGWQAASGELVIFVDDDVEAPRTWLPALLAAARATPERDVFAGPIRADIEGGGPRSCGRDTPPITTLDHGAADVDIAVGWSANLAIRRAALETVGGFDESIAVGAGDEEEWQERYRSTGGRVRYVAAAGPGAPPRRGRRDAARARSRAVPPRSRGARAGRAQRRRAVAAARAATRRGLRCAHAGARMPERRDAHRARARPDTRGVGLSAQHCYAVALWLHASHSASCATTPPRSCAASRKASGWRSRSTAVRWRSWARSSGAGRWCRATRSCAKFAACSSPDDRLAEELDEADTPARDPFA